VVWIEPGVADDIGMPFALSPSRRSHRRRIEELGDGTTMTCISGISCRRFESMSTGWKARDRRRRPQDPGEIKAGMPAGGKGADVPDHRTLGVKIGGADQQQAAAVVFAGDRVEHLLVGEFSDHLGQWGRVGHGIAEQSGAETSPAKDPVGSHGRVDFP
jgi:hypothetical protein